MNAIYAVRIEVDPNDEKAWDEWHTRQHIPDVLAAHPGLVRALKYKVDANSDEWRQYLVLYEFDSREAMDEYLTSEEVVRLRADHFAHFGSSTRLSRMLLTPTVLINKSSGNAA